MTMGFPVTVSGKRGSDRLFSGFIWFSGFVFFVFFIVLQMFLIWEGFNLESKKERVVYVFFLERVQRILKLERD